MKLEAYDDDTDDKFELLETLDLNKASVRELKTFIDKYALFYSIYLEENWFVSNYFRRIETEEEIEEILKLAKKNDIEELRIYLHDWLG